MEFIFPLDGDVLTPADAPNGKITVILRAKPKTEICLNGIPCRREGELAIAELPLPREKTILTARQGREEISITVYRFPKADRKLRLAIDDIIRCLREIALQEPDSLFDHPFLALFRDLHRAFGAKTHLNIYYTDGNGFDLSQFPDRYRSEWEEAADYLRLTFHARADKPNRIYRQAPYEEVFQDFKQVTQHIIRFAGDKIWRTRANGLHFAETTREGARAMRDQGADLLVGYFIFDQKGKPAVSYYLDKEQTRHLAHRDFWVDTREKILFSRDKLVLDQTPLEEIAPTLDRLLAENPEGMGTLNLVTHEQYFYPDYKHYRPDYGERIRTALKWALDHGFTPAFPDEYLPETF